MAYIAQQTPWATRHSESTPMNVLSELSCGQNRAVTTGFIASKHHKMASDKLCLTLCLPARVLATSKRN